MGNPRHDAVASLPPRKNGHRRGKTAEGPQGGSDGSVPNRAAFRELSGLFRDGMRPVAFVGAGLSVRAGYPAWETLLRKMGDRAHKVQPIPEKDRGNLGNLRDVLWRAEAYREVMGRKVYASFLKRTFASRKLALDSVIRAVVELPFAHYFTTNFDDVIEQAHEMLGKPRPEVVEWAHDRAIRTFFQNVNDAGTRHCVHVHGTATDIANVIFTDRDYAARYRRSDDARRKLFSVFATQRVVFIGFSLEDPAFEEILREVQACFGPGAPTHFAILALDPSRQSERLERLRLRGKFGVEPIFYPLTSKHENLATLLVALQERKTDYGSQWAKAHEEAGAVAAVELPPVRDPADPQKGRWGRRDKHNDRVLSATVRETPGDPDWFVVRLKIESTSPKRPLIGPVHFHLHDTFPDPDPEVESVKGVALLEFSAYGAFTVGAETDGGETRLELDLAQLPQAPTAFRER